MQDQGLDCGKHVGVCRERAASMVSCHSGATAKIKSRKQKSTVYNTHCITCHEHLAAQKLLPD